MSAHDPDLRTWFGSSKVASEDGSPLLLYHSTNAVFDRFEKTADIGFHFGTAAQAAARAAKKGNDRTLEVYLSIKNPVEMPDLGDWDFWRFTEDGMLNSYFENDDGSLTVAFSEKDVEYVIEQLDLLDSTEAGYEWLRNFFESRGFDGIKYLNVGETADNEAGDYSYIAFRPEQILIASVRDHVNDPELTDAVCSMAY